MAASQRAYSIKTRIKTLGGYHLAYLIVSQRAYSIKTRIKTRYTKEFLSTIFMPQRAYSIKTRIKTYSHAVYSLLTTQLREHIPLKQGLRLIFLPARNIRRSSQRAYSIKTRIKTTACLRNPSSSSISESIFH